MDIYKPLLYSNFGPYLLSFRRRSLVQKLNVWFPLNNAPIQGIRLVLNLAVLDPKEFLF